MAPQVQSAFLPALVAALGSGAPEEAETAGEASEPKAPTPVFTSGITDQSAERPLNPFTVLKNVQSDYLTYVRTFQRFQNPQIREWVVDESLDKLAGWLGVAAG